MNRYATIAGPIENPMFKKAMFVPYRYISAGIPINVIAEKYVAIREKATGSMDMSLPARRYSSLVFCLFPENRK
ncbi:hypothetical protein X975_27078, partial [Stegodyphus mimosarum]